jgi:hypothetical protein
MLKIPIFLWESVGLITTSIFIFIFGNIYCGRENLELDSVYMRKDSFEEGRGLSPII